MGTEGRNTHQYWSKNRARRRGGKGPAGPHSGPHRTRGTAGQPAAAHAVDQLHAPATTHPTTPHVAPWPAAAAGWPLT